MDVSGAYIHPQITDIYTFWSLSFVDILAIPGKSIRVRSGTCVPYIVKMIGSSTIPLYFPATSSVKRMMCCRTTSKSSILVSFSVLKQAQGLPSGQSYSDTCTKRSSRGLRVTTPAPLGRKSIPTIDSNTLLFPAL
eukprot:GHVO01050739.1.p2 GENE.GHVO01050739.1~~GHVO01050739.1.p2  ORF type:complete len:136 (-),score=3.88 GHVO01050739.1:86-493(-)